MKKRKIAIFTTTRADFGLLKPLIKELSSKPEVQLELVVSGTHFSGQFGNSSKEIEDAGVRISHTFEIFDENFESSPEKASAIMMMETAKFIQSSQPDLLVILGDRFEMLAAAFSSALNNVPIAHIAGGEVTTGALDDSFRHAITKLSSIHFCSTLTYKKRIIQLGERPETVHLVGSLALDNFASINKKTPQQLSHLVGFDIETQKFTICTLHPETARTTSASEFLQPIFQSLLEVPKLKVIFTRTNSDLGGNEIWQEIQAFVKKRPADMQIIENFGHESFLSILPHASFIIGNSSSGIYEAPSAGIPTVNVGSRQYGRLRSPSVIDARNTKEEITKAIMKALSSEFSEISKQKVSPFGEAGAAGKISKILSSIELENLLPKSFHDIEI